MEKNATILVTGSTGLVGTSLVNKLKSENYKKILILSSKKLDLRNQSEVDKYFKNNKVDYVLHLAAKVGGFKEKMSAPAEFLYDNLLISCNVIEASRKYNIKRLIFIGTSCIYSIEAKQPFKEDSFFLGELQPVNKAYGLAKIVGLELCEYYNKQYKTNFISLIPCSLYGPNDNFKSNPHMIASLILKLHNAKEKNLPFVEIDCSGKMGRQFLFVDDLADAIVYFIKYPDINQLKPFINVGCERDISLNNLSLIIKEIVGYSGKIKFDETKRGGKRLLDVGKARKLGWASKVALKDGIKITYDWFVKNKC